MDDMKRRILYKNEVKIELRSARTIAFTIVGNIILAICMLFFLKTVFTSDSAGYSTDYKAVLLMYNTLLLVEYIVILCSVLIMSSATLTREYETRTIHLLLLSGVETADIINAKIKKIVAVHLMMIITTMPVLCIVFSVGGVNILNLIAYILVVMSSVLCYASVGLYVSAKVRKLTVSVFITALVELITTLGSYMLFGTIYQILDGSNDFISKVKVMGNLLVTNPVMSILKLQADVAGNTSTFVELMQNYGVVKVVEVLWIPISITIQLIVAYIFISKTKSIMKENHSE